jgi:hypothetical protein
MQLHYSCWGARNANRRMITAQGPTRFDMIAQNSLLRQYRLLLSALYMDGQ